MCCYLFWWYGRVQGVEAPDRWKWTFSHLPSRRYHTRVSSLCCVCACPCLKSNSIKFKKKIQSNFLPEAKRQRKLLDAATHLSTNWVRRTYAMQAASSPIKWMWGLRISVLIDLQFLPRTGRRRKENILRIWALNKHKVLFLVYGCRRRICGTRALPRDCQELPAQTMSHAGRIFS